MEKKSLEMGNRVSAAIAVLFILGAIGPTHAQHSESTTESRETEGNQPAIQDPGPDVHPAPNIEEKRIRRIFQDKSGNLWFGTDGLFRYDGDSLEYFSIEGAYGGAVVRGIAEDKEGNVWFGVHGGIIKYDGESFTRFTEKDGLINNDVWSIAIDSKGIIWIGTLEGVCRFDGNTFTPFPIPAATKRDYNKGVWSPTRVGWITEDSVGNMWFASEGGVFKYDGEILSRISVMDRQSDTNVASILEDKNGNIWFGTNYKGVICFDGELFTNFTQQEGLSGTEVGSLYEDKSGNIWFPVEGLVCTATMENHLPISIEKMVLPVM